MRIFLDTNVLVSALTARGLAADLFRLVASKHKLVTGEVNLTELARVLRLKFDATPEDLRVAEAAITPYEIIAKPPKPSALSLRDPDDEWVLASAIAGLADILVTGDQDLLSLENPPLVILSPRQCWEKLRR